ncbi:hypothetical protein F180042I2_09460 [Enterocloster bolteae]
MTVKKWIAMITLSMLFSGTLIWEAYAGTWKQGIDGDLSACCMITETEHFPYPHGCGLMVITMELLSAIILMIQDVC